MKNAHKPFHRIQDSVLDSHPTTGGQRSPLRYPGGKTRAVPLILALIPNSVTKIISPFVGGASVEIALADSGREVRGFDAFPPLVHFWQKILANPDKLADLIEKYHPLPATRFYELQKLSFEDHDIDAAVFFVLNRSSFSGSTLSGGMSPEHPRFTQTAIERVRQFRCPNLTVAMSDFKETIKLQKDDFMYLDPPYLIASSLYGRRGSTHKGFDHEGLANSVRGKNQWLMSYNDHPDIRELYSGYRIISPEWTYGMGNKRESREILILSNDLPEIIRPNNV